MKVGGKEKILECRSRNLLLTMLFIYLIIHIFVYYVEGWVCKVEGVGECMVKREVREWEACTLR